MREELNSLVGLVVLLAGLGYGQALPSRMKGALQNELKASPEQLKMVEEGGAVAYIMPQDNPEEIVLVGVTRIWATPEAFVRSYRDITKFEAAPGVLAGGKYSRPPKVSDMSGLRLSAGEVDDLLDCKPGDCDFKISDRGLEYLKGKIQRSAPNYVEQANQAVRALWIDYLKRYQATGNSALAVYHDTPKYFSVQKALHELVAHSGFLREYSPGLAAYLDQYPKGKLPGSEEFYYWQVAEFGLKPVHRATHVVIAKAPASFGTAYVIAAKMLFASHYFRGALEIRYLIPGQDQTKGGMHYLIVVQRSYVDGMTGVKGKILRGIVLDKSREAMEGYLGVVKGRVEQSFKKK